MEKTLADHHEEFEQRVAPWSTPKKIFFRFFFIFFTLFIIVENNGAFPLFEYVTKYVDKLLHQFIPWVGSHLLHLPNTIIIFTNGSGDTTYDYVATLCCFLIAVAGTLGWSAMDRNRSNYSKLYYVLTVVVRFYVGLMLINYGFIKVFKLQFSSPSPYRLMQPYGDSSPMGLAWTFLGFSKGYNFFMGVVEMMGILLLFRRTMTAGVIVCLFTSMNVMALNYFYDVPVKIIATALVVMCCFLLANDFEKIFRFFFLGQATRLPMITPLTIKTKWLRYGLQGFKILLIGYVIVDSTLSSLSSLKLYGAEAPRSAFYGLHNVDTFVLNKDTIQPLTTDTLRWRQIIIGRPGFATVKMMNDTLRGYVLKIDTLKKEAIMFPRLDTTKKHFFRYQVNNQKQLLMYGKKDRDSLFIKLTHYDPAKFRLVSRGFNWVNEYPYNR
jgi:hypothetical protein